MNPKLQERGAGSLAFVAAVVALCASCTGLRRVSPDLIPEPLVFSAGRGSFELSRACHVNFEGDDPALSGVAAYLTEVLELGVQSADARGPGEHGILLRTRSIVDWDAGPEGYRLRVSARGIEIEAETARGVFWGVQTLRQLLPPGWTAKTGPAKVAATRISDRPRFPWRGMHLDSARHMQSVAFIKKYIDQLAAHKLNTFHWHLTEDQGWRIEIERYPRLTSVGAWRTKDGVRYGGFYTQDEVREVVAHAARRFITVVPEIEMPGHAMGALAAHPEVSCTGGPFEVSNRWGVREDVYCAGKEETFTFLENILDEVLELFPSEFIHIGGDECPKTRWKACPDCQARIAKEGLADEHELQSYFVQRIGRYLEGRNRRLVGWDEILEGGLAEDATVMSWRGVAGGIAAAKAGHDVVMSPTSHCYFDYPPSEAEKANSIGAGVLSTERVYSFEPIPDELTAAEGRFVLGGQGNVWTEYMPTERRVELMAFPRLSALAEVLWSAPEKRDWERFRGKLSTHRRRLAAADIHYFVDQPRGLEPEGFFIESVEIELEPNDPGAEIRYTLDGGEPGPESLLYAGPIHISTDTTIKAIEMHPDGGKSPVATGHYRRTVLERAEFPGGPLEPGLRRDYYEGEWDRLPDFAALTPVATDSAPVVGMPDERRDDDFGLRFTGFLRILEDGVYTFRLASDDGSRLTIGDQCVIDHDGLHSRSSKSRQVALGEGYHAFALEFFERGGLEFLNLGLEGPGLEGGPLPASMLFRP